MNKWLFGALAYVVSGHVWAAHDTAQLEEIVVTAPFQRTQADTMLPVTVLTGDALKEEVGNTLGDTLANQVGVTSASFGNGVGLPVIRGQSGNRVQVMQNGVSALDAAAVSPDHSNGVEAIVAERIEVVRGPATLLYGNGAIGGVVNVIDNRIGKTLPEETSLQIEQRRNSASKQDSTVVDINGAIGQVALHFDGFYRDSKDLKIKGFAIDTAALGLTGEESDELTNTYGFIANSDVEASGVAGGASLVFDRGYLGYSISRLDNDYGLPPGVHAHEEDSEGESAGEDAAQEFVRLVMKQTRQDLRGAWQFDSGLLDSLELKVAHNDYQHEELEIEAGKPPTLGTRFENRGFEGRLTVSHAPLGGWQGVLGMQVIDRVFSASGEEAYIPESDINAIGLFLVESFDTDKWLTELGARVERQRIDPSAACRKTVSSMSLGASVIRQLSPGNLLLSLQRAERSPTVEEYFSNVDAVTCRRQVDDEDLVLHASTRLFEIGSRGLDTETSNNLELGFRKTQGRVTGEFNAYYNRISDYIFLNTGAGERDGAAIAAYEQRDATFRGFEAEVMLPVTDTGATVTQLTLFGDYVRASFSGGESGGERVPRIPPLRAGVEFAVLGDVWSGKIRTTFVARQDRITDDESVSDGYTRLDVYADYHFDLAQGEVLLFVKGSNLLNEEIRNHTAFVKDLAPQAGRGAEIGIRLSF